MVLTWYLAFMISVLPTTQETAKERPPGPVHVLSFIFNLFWASFVLTIEGPAWFNSQNLNTLLMGPCWFGVAILGTPVFMSSINFFANLDLFIDPRFNTPLHILGLTCT
ncbi:hypothetical protein F4604DRAFT_1762222 [Suillus subluteus]|nr:hypothetical protein F4604DRAFT_1762222 [Suillus subluteus]